MPTNVSQEKLGSHWWGTREGSSSASQQSNEQFKHSDNRTSNYCVNKKRSDALVNEYTVSSKNLRKHEHSSVQRKWVQFKWTPEQNTQRGNVTAHISGRWYTNMHKTKLRTLWLWHTMANTWATRVEDSIHIHKYTCSYIHTQNHM